MNNVPFHIFYEIQQAFEDVGHIYFCMPSHSSFLHVGKWVLGHVKSNVRQNDLQNHRTLLSLH